MSDRLSYYSCPDGGCWIRLSHVVGFFFGGGLRMNAVKYVLGGTKPDTHGCSTWRARSTQIVCLVFFILATNCESVCGCV